MKKVEERQLEKQFIEVSKGEEANLMPLADHSTFDTVHVLLIRAGVSAGVSHFSRHVGN